MTTRKPLVIASGLIQELPTGDTLSSGAAAKEVTQTSHGFSVGHVLYLNGSTYTLADADAIATAEVVGIVSAVANANTFTLLSVGHITGLSGLTAGVVYFLSSTAGALTATEPSTPGQVSKPLLIADSTTSGYFFNMRGMLVGSGTLDHGALGGLTDDDHTQYALLAGRSGGQTLIGGTAAGDDLRLKSTSDSNKGTVFVGEVGLARPTTFDLDYYLMHWGADDYCLPVISTCSNTAGTIPGLIFYRARGTHASPAIVQLSDPVGTIAFYGDDGSSTPTLAAQISASVDGTPGADDMPGSLQFLTTADGGASPTERMRINSFGTVAVGEASPPTVVSTLSLFSGLTGNGDHSLRISQSGASGQRICQSYNFTASTPDDNTSVFALAYDNNFGNLRYIVYSDGDVQNHDNSYGATSDERLKQDIRDATSQWADVKALRLRKYRFISDVEAKGDAAVEHLGVIAQEVEPVSPGLVTHGTDPMTGGELLGVQYSILYLKAVGALQEAMVRIETLESTVAAMQARLAALEAKP